MLVGYAVGGPSDTIARIMADRMKVALGQPVIIENVTGAAGSLAGLPPCLRASQTPRRSSRQAGLKRAAVSRRLVLRAFAGPRSAGRA